MSKHTRCETVHDPDLGTIRQVVDEDGAVLATATMSPVYRDGSFFIMDESHVWAAGHGLMPRPGDLA